jgi:hypothetical protein
LGNEEESAIHTKHLPAKGHMLPKGLLPLDGPK